jgi:hypothetical protein
MKQASQVYILGETIFLRMKLLFREYPQDRSTRFARSSFTFICNQKCGCQKGLGWLLVSMRKEKIARFQRSEVPGVSPRSEGFRSIRRLPSRPSHASLCTRTEFPSFEPSFPRGNFQILDSLCSNLVVAFVSHYPGELQAFHVQLQSGHPTKHIRLMGRSLRKPDYLPLNASLQI